MQIKEIEEWRDIPKYLGFYQASSWGRIKSLARSVLKSSGVVQHKVERILKQSLTHGYLRVPMQLSPTTKKKESVQRMVAAAFYGESPMTVDHIDNDKTNNRADNLRYATHRDNVGRHFKNVSKSGYVGVGWCKKKQLWRARVSFNGKEYHIGYFLTAEDAYLFREAKIKELKIYDEPVRPHPHKKDQYLNAPN